MTLEISLETRAVMLLLSRGANPIKYGQDGLPDRMVLWGKGRHFWIEFKKFRTGRLRAMQVIWKKYLNRIGDDVYVIDSYEQVEQVIEMWEKTYGPATAKRVA
jgi:hypothetical protein